MLKNSSRVSYPSQIPLGLDDSGIVLYWIFHPEDDDKSLVLVLLDEDLVESLSLLKD